MKITDLSVTILLLIFFGYSCSNVREDNNQNSSAPQPDSISSSQGTYISYQSCGSGDITLFFIHGWCIDQSFWSYQRDGFCPDYRVVTIDLPGFGQSGKQQEDWSIEQFGNDVNSVIEQLNLTKVVLIGHSMGGDIILEAAKKNEDIVALVGVDNFKEVGLEFDPQMEQEINGFLEVLQSNFSEVASAYAEGALFHPTTDSMAINRVISSILNSDSLVAVKTLEALFRYTPKESQSLGQLKQKLYLINSDASPTDTATLSEIGVSFQLSEIAQSGHYPMIEKPGQFNQMLLEILGEIQTKSH